MDTENPVYCPAEVTTQNVNVTDAVDKHCPDYGTMENPEVGEDPSYGTVENPVFADGPDYCTMGNPEGDENPDYGTIENPAIGGDPDYGTIEDNGSSTQTPTASTKPTEEVIYMEVS